MQNAQNFNEMASDKRWVNLMGAMKEARRELKTLAPHPTREDRKDPLFVRDTRGASNDDSSLASLMIGMALSHFAISAGMPAWAENVNLGAGIEIYDEYQNNIKNSRTNGEGTDGYTLGEKGAITGGFNMNTTHRAVTNEKDAAAWEAYMQDLPKRRVVEQSIAAMNRDADRREQQILRQHRAVMAYAM